MIMQLLPALTLICVIGAGLIGGVFLAFSSFVMSALGRLTPEQGVAAMQSINVTVINPLFLGIFMGTGGVCLLLMAVGISRWQEPGTLFLLAGTALYLIGTIAVTMICNVPLNDGLAAADPASVQTASLWQNYLANWTMWNHVRTIAATLSAVAFALAFRQMAAVA